MNANLYVIEDYENETTLRPQKNKPKQTQFRNNSNRYFPGPPLFGKRQSLRNHFYLGCEFVRYGCAAVESQLNKNGKY